MWLARVGGWEEEGGRDVTSDALELGAILLQVLDDEGSDPRDACGGDILSVAHNDNWHTLTKAGLGINSGLVTSRWSGL